MLDARRSAAGRRCSVCRPAAGRRSRDGDRARGRRPRRVAAPHVHTRDASATTRRRWAPSTCASSSTTGSLHARGRAGARRAVRARARRRPASCARRWPRTSAVRSPSPSRPAASRSMSMPDERRPEQPRRRATALGYEAGDRGSARARHGRRLIAERIIDGRPRGRGPGALGPGAGSRRWRRSTSATRCPRRCTSRWPRRWPGPTGSTRRARRGRRAWLRRPR